MWFKISYFDVWPKLNILQENDFILRINIMASPQNVPIFDFQRQFPMTRIV